MSSKKHLDFFGNWKMAQTLNTCSEFLNSFQLQSSDQRRIAIFPSFTHLSFMHTSVREKKLGISLGGQDCSTQAKGAFTGEISAAMLKEMGCEFVLVGHSERRARANETESTLKEKLNQVFDSNLTPVYCIGETESQRNAHQVFDVLESQLKVLASETRPFIIAYEPVWAIGTGKVASLKDIDEAHTFIQSKVPQTQSILYGGSVKPDNAKEILEIHSVTGLLIGGASLKAADFTSIINSY